MLSNEVFDALQLGQQLDLWKGRQSILKTEVESRVKESYT